MTSPQINRLWSRAIGCYLCWSVAGACLGAIAASLESSTEKSILVVLAAILFVGGGVALAVDQDRIRRRYEKERQEADSDGSS